MTRKRHIVIVDDEPNIGLSLRMILEGEGYRVTVCDSAASFRAERRSGRADLYLLDVRLPDGNGVDLLRSLKQEDDATPAVMISGHATIRDAVDATRSGAFDFLEKPLARDRVLLVVKNALERSDLQRENERFRELVGDAPKMIGASAPFLHAVQQATRVARSDVSVLLSGESGTGKELLAAHIHRESPWASGPFVKVNCAAIPTELIESELFGHEKGAFTGAAALRRGKFELADGGSIFLDEVGDLHEASQAKLLRILQDGELQRVGGEQPVRVAVRVISATNRRLEELIASGRFREDLYYRLSVVPILVPALRERLQDIGELASYFLAEFSARNNFRPRDIEPDVVPLLERYSWPGNVRELRNVVERMAILTPGDRITAESIPLELRLPPSSRAAAGLQETRDSAERERIRQALDQTDWNVSGAARLLGTERTSLHKRIRALGLKRR
ncbi:MAG TPA: sigma-54 dependent transcriptional regulator [Vicinamibacterales bacterium]|nr:sigma-54 dependent transcriptional regulator [Vicinamibacterales bacterium]